MPRSIACALIASLSIALMTACATVVISRTVDPTYEPDLRNEMLYGRFQLTEDSRNPAGLDNGIVLSISRLTQPRREYGIRFDENRDAISVLALPAGEYLISHLEFINGLALREARGELRLSPGARTFTIRPGTAYYAGDWVGTFSNDERQGPFVVRRWRLRSIEDAKARSSAELADRYPKLSELPVRSIPLLSSPEFLRYQEAATR